MSSVQEWHGYVQSVEDYTFTAVLTDVTHGSEPDAIAVFQKASLSQSDLEWLEENVYLRWTLTPDAEHPERMNSKVSLVLDRWTADDLDTARQRAAEFATDIIWE
jgi:hypothetical protein